MNREERMALIKSIEEKRNSKMIVYISGDRRGLETKIATDIFPMFYKHLTEIETQKGLDLFLYSKGGITIAGYTLVNLFREFCTSFNVIIPFRAHSCATLIALGANDIVMTRMGQLSPIDPSIEHALAPNVGGRIVPLNVEDVNAFIDLAKKEAGLDSEESMYGVFELLASQVSPLVLGAVHRSREEITFLASSLMEQHTTNKKQIKKIVDTLTRERFSHSYIINRREAKDVLNLSIVEPDEELTALIVGLFEAYSEMLMLNDPYNPEVVLGTENQKTVVFDRAVIESPNLTHVFRTTKEIKRVQMPISPAPGIPPGIGYQERVLKEGWEIDNKI